MRAIFLATFLSHLLGNSVHAQTGGCNVVFSGLIPMMPTVVECPNDGKKAPAQLIACPESIGGAPQACGIKRCGQEDPEHEGHCKNKAVDNSQCACDPKGEAIEPFTSVMTATPPGATAAVTGTYALATLNDYKGLKESKTVTLTRSATEEGKPAATVAAVVFAGGVTWLLAEIIGGEAAAGVLKPPPDAGPEHPDDEICKEKNLKCKDCGGVFGFCVEKTPGCVCEEEEEKCPTTKPSCDDAKCAGNDGKCTIGDLKECECENRCPEGDKKPKCEDEKCKGADGKCTAENKGCECTNSCPNGDKKPKCEDKKCKGVDGKCTQENKGCDCAETECPEPIEAPFCEDCGGDQPDAKGNPTCKGGDKAKFQFQGCPCHKSAEPDLPPYQYPVDPKTANDRWNKMKGQIKEDPVCQKQNPEFTVVSVPRREADGETSVEKVAKEFCKSQDGKTIKRGERPFKKGMHEFSAVWVSAQLRKSPPKSLNCGNEAKIKGDECIDTIMKAVDRCGPAPGNKKMTLGASLPKGCFVYGALVDGTLGDRPAWTSDEAWPQCGGEVTKIPNEFFQGLIPQFCGDVKEGKPVERTLTNKDFKPASSRSKRTPPPSSGQYEGWHFDFEFSGAENCKPNCVEALNDLASNCGSGGTTVLDHGEYKTGCGTYKYSIRPSAEPGESQEGLYPPKRPVIHDGLEPSLTTSDKPKPSGKLLYWIHKYMLGP